jgi:hypothetical protein
MLMTASQSSIGNSFGDAVGARRMIRASHDGFDAGNAK